MTLTLTDNSVFQTDSRALYILRPLTPEQASDLGCPGATCQLEGRIGKTVGTWRAVTGRLVRVPGWSKRLGYRAEFTPWGAAGETFEQPLRGYAGL